MAQIRMFTNLSRAKADEIAQEFRDSGPNWTIKITPDNKGTFTLTATHPDVDADTPSKDSSSRSPPQPPAGKPPTRTTTSASRGQTPTGGKPSVPDVSDTHLQAHGHGNDVEKPNVDKHVRTDHKSSRQRSKIDYIVIHYTTSRNIKGAIDTFQNGRINPKTGKLIRTSAHYIVGTNGTLVQMVDDSDAAWHAGPGKIKNMNSRSIGIEHCANPGDKITPDKKRNQLVSFDGLLRNTISL